MISIELKFNTTAIANSMIFYYPPKLKCRIRIILSPIEKNMARKLLQAILVYRAVLPMIYPMSIMHIIITTKQMLRIMPICNFLHL